MRNTITAVDFGTSKITVLVADTNDQLRCDIVGHSSVEYAGYSDGQWNDPASVNPALEKAVQIAQTQSRRHIKDVVVGVPGEFSRVYSVESTVDLANAGQKVSANEIDMIFKGARDKLSNTPGIVIYNGVAWFKVDNGRKILVPVGQTGNTLRGQISLVVADQFFLDDVTNRFRSMDIPVRSFLSTPQGQAMLYITEEERRRVSVLVDVGYLNTDVMIIEGDALVYLRTLPMGGGSMAADLAYGLNIPLKSAEQIKRSYMFDSDGEDEDFSVEDRDGEKKNFTRDEVKEVLEPRAEEICEAIADAIKLSGVRLTQQSAIYLTGGGLAYNRGSRELLSRFVNRPVRELRPMVRRLSGPMFTSAIGLLDYAVDEWNRDNASRGIKSFFSSLFA